MSLSTISPTIRRTIWYHDNTFGMSPPVRQVVNNCYNSLLGAPKLTRRGTIKAIGSIYVSLTVLNARMISFS